MRRIYDILPWRKPETPTDVSKIESWSDVNLAEELRNGNLPQFPHCDAAVLHAPGDCTYCDEHKEWQILRHVWSINFTGHRDPSKMTCPAELRRNLDQIERWGGNVPTNPQVDPEEMQRTITGLVDLVRSMTAVIDDLLEDAVENSHDQPDHQHNTDKNP